MKYKFNKNIIKLFFLLVLPFLAIFVVNFLVNYVTYPVCLWKNIFHVDCLGCGMTRAFYYLYHFDFDSAMKYNNKIIVVAPILIFIWILEIIKIIKEQNKN